MQALKSRHAELYRGCTSLPPITVRAPLPSSSVPLCSLLMTTLLTGLKSQSSLWGGTKKGAQRSWHARVGQRSNLGVGPYLSLSCVSEQLACELGVPCLHPHAVVGTLGLQMHPITSGFDVGSGDFNPSPHAVAASSLLSGNSFHLNFFDDQECRTFSRKLLIHLVFLEKLLEMILSWKIYFSRI